MNDMISEDKRKQLTSDYSKQFQNATPFPYVAIDDFLEEKL